MDELQKIWCTLADNQLIDRNLAKDNVLQIITRKGSGVIHKMKRKSRFDYNMQLFALIVIPIAIIFVIGRYSVHLQMTVPLAPILILSLMELMMVFLFRGSLRNLKLLDYSFNTESIKESLTHIRTHFRVFLKKSYWTGLIAMWFILLMIQLEILWRIGGIHALNFSNSGEYRFDSWFLVFIVGLMGSIPFIMKFDMRKYASAMRDLEETIAELESA